ncbi:hypothetical protein PANT_24d00043 [Moesziomyces antarcticus T-34]|uniref:Myb-like domain-containing protein n=1 Tax=Pseudozyma antarctica (strain T-34) TaxID=1151754 RepID=M9MGK1_PSEA3|nr:hypothetical protein PANT_24d00043 [Moesziomyces antarcticus T-34]
MALCRTRYLSYAERGGQAGESFPHLSAPRSAFNATRTSQKRLNPISFSTSYITISTSILPTMAKNFYDSDTEVDELADVKSPKKVKRQNKNEAKLELGDDSPNKRKRAAGTGGRNSWTKEEEEDLLNCLQEIIAAGMTSFMHKYPRLAARKSDGCVKHWYSYRRKLETTLLGGPTINNNGKKINELVSPKKDE